MIFCSFSSYSLAGESLEVLKAQFETARAKARDLAAKGAPEVEISKQRKLVEDLREKMRIKQSESFSGLGT